MKDVKLAEMPSLPRTIVGIVTKLTDSDWVAHLEAPVKRTQDIFHS